jgi:hypothetical protein
LNDYRNRIIYVDAGSYIFTDTITIPPGSRLLGESWAQLVAFGQKFNDANNPRPLIKVGDHDGIRGSVQLQDLLFTSKGPTAGLIAVEWNIQGTSRSNAAMWGMCLFEYCRKQFNLLTI